MKLELLLAKKDLLEKKIQLVLNMEMDQSFTK